MSVCCRHHDVSIIYINGSILIENVKNATESKQNLVSVRIKSSLHYENSSPLSMLATFTMSLKLYTEVKNYV